MNRQAGPVDGTFGSVDYVLLPEYRRDLVAMAGRARRIFARRGSGVKQV
jgi:hypothetical protein